MKPKRLLLAACCLCSAVPPVLAQWNQNTGTGPFNYTNTANWSGGIVNNVFQTNPTTGATIQFSANLAFSSLLTLGYGGSPAVTFSSDSATARTLQLNGGIELTNSGGGTVTLGTTAAPLIFDLAGALATLGGPNSSPGTANSTMNINAQIIDSSGHTNGINVAGGRVFSFLLNNNNSFIGPVKFWNLRGGGFSSINRIGAGASALGAPTDSTNGTVTVVDGASNGSLKYNGAGNTSDRPFAWSVTYNNILANAYSFQNTGTGKLTLTGPWTLSSSASSNTFIVNGLSNTIELDGFISGNNGLTHIQFAGTNILGGATNNFFSCELGSGVLQYSTISNAGLACSLGTNGIMSIRGGAFQYIGTNAFATNTRTLQFTPPGTSWSVENVTTNSTLVIAGTVTGASYPTNQIGLGGLIGPGTNAAGARTLNLNVYQTTESGPSGPLLVQSQISDMSPSNTTTVVAGGATGYTAFNGGTVGLLNTANTFSGAVQVKYARTLQVASLTDSNMPCSIGLGTNPPAGTGGIIMGSTDSQRGGVLAYVGSNNVSSCNRQICVEGVNFGGSSSATIVNNSPNNSGLHLSCTNPIFYYAGVLVSNCAFTLGGSAAAVNTLDSPITNTPLGSAGLTLNGAAGSTWILTATNTYASNTLLASGTLLVNGSIAGQVLTNTAGVLGGSGTIFCPVFIQAGGTIQPGPGGSSIGTLTVNNTLSLAGTTVMNINRTGTPAASLIQGVSTLACGGVLTVNNTGAPLQAGDSFTLFAASSYTGTFSATNLPALSSGLVWDVSKLGINGTVTVAALPAVTSLTPSSPTIECSTGSITFSASGSGSGSLSYLWSVSGTPVSGATNSVFTFTNAQSGSSPYNIAVLVSSQYGTASSNTFATVVDTTPPVVTLNGSRTMTVECHGSFTDPGASALDACAGALGVSETGSVDVNTPGQYPLVYSATDPSSNTGTATRMVTVSDTTPPVISYYFTNLTVSVDANCSAVMPDVTGTNYIIAEDACSGTNLVISQQPTNNATLVLGTNEVVIAVSDLSGNTVYSTNTIVVADTTPPVITILGANPATVECHESYTDAGATAIDNCTLASLVTNGVVDTTTPGTYTVSYIATDAAGNSTTNNRTINVVDTTPPVITQCVSNQTLALNSNCVAILPDLTGQIVAYDNCSSSIRVTQSPAPGASLSAGTTSVIFWVDDGNGNTNNCSATITVTDQTLPVITLQPVSQTNNVGTSASFSAAASSCSALSYAWYHGTNLLAGQTNATVTINPAGSADAGAYQAVVSSVAGTTNSQTAILTIVNQVPVIVSSAILPDGTFQLIFQATPGQTYHVLGTDDLTTPLPDWPILTNGTFGSTNAIYTEMATNAQQFYIIESP